MRRITIPVFTAPDGAVLSAKVKVTLVDARGHALLGQTLGGEPVTGSVTLTSGATPTEIELTPQDQIDPISYYRIEVSASGRTETYTSQIASGDTPLNWAELVQPGSPVTPAELDAWTLHLADDQRHLPDAAGVPDGYGLQLQGGVPVWGAGAGSSIPPHIQGDPLATWTVAHQLGRYPSVTVVDPDGGQLLARVSYQDSNILFIEFSVPTSGRAYLN